TRGGAAGGPGEQSGLGRRAVRLPGMPGSCRGSASHPDPQGSLPPAFVQDLDARVGHADGVCVVTMFLVGLAGEPGPEQLDAVDGAVLATPPTPDPGHARSTPPPADAVCLRHMVPTPRALELALRAIYDHRASRGVPALRCGRRRHAGAE